MSFLMAIIPFGGVLLSIALWPLASSRFWAKHQEKIIFSWAGLAFVVPILAPASGLHNLVPALMHAGHGLGEIFFLHYFPFMALLGTLYVVAGGVRLHIHVRASPWMNSCFLAIASVVAGFVGTTGASMLGIHPLMLMNKHRAYRSHTVIFFIFLVCNIGGCLSPVGDPPLFLGFLKGVPFQWPLKNLLVPFGVIALPLLCMYGLLDAWYFRQEPPSGQEFPKRPRLRLEGWAQPFLALLAIGSLVVSGLWNGGNCAVGPWLVPVANLVRDLFLLGLCGLSFYFAPTHLRKKWGWRWHPLREIAVLFVGIFVTAHPVIELLSQGGDGPFGPLLSWLVNPLTGALEPGRLFWVTGIFSAFLDNAPAYLIFFTMAGGDAQVLATTMNAVLVAISAGAVFMGALTYIGNAPNLLVKAIAEEEYKVAMPSFFGYMAWSLIFVVPLLLIVGLLL